MLGPPSGRRRSLAITLAIAFLGLSCREPPSSLEDQLVAGDFVGVRASVPGEIHELEVRHPDPLDLAEELSTLARSITDASGGLSPDAWEAADQLLRRALTLRERHAGDGLAVADTLDQLADIAYYRGRWDDAAEFESRALDHLVRLLPRSHPRLAAGAYDLALYRFQRGDYREAERWIEEALARFDRTEPAADPLAVADALNIRGELYRIQDRLSEAEASYRSGLELARPAGGDADPVVLDLTNNLVGLLKDIGRFGDAEVLYRPVREAFETNPNLAFSLPTAYLNTAEIYRLQGRYEEAEPLYRQALELARRRRGGDDPRLAVFINQYAALFAERGELSRAEELYREALAHLNRTPTPDPLPLAQTRQDLAETLLEQGRLREAESEYRLVLAQREKTLGPQHPETALSAAGLARCLSAADPARHQEALALTAHALEALGRSPAHPEARIEALTLRAELLDRSGERDRAIDALSLALDGVEVLRPALAFGDSQRARQFAGFGELYFRIASWQVEAGDPEKAFESMERAKARVFLDQLAAARVDLTQGIPADRLEQLRGRANAARLRLSEAQARAGGRTSAAAEDAIQAAARELEESEQELRAASPLWHQVVTRGGRPLPLAAARNGLAPGELALAYLLANDAGLVFVVGGGADDLSVHSLELSTAGAAALGIAPGPVGRVDLEHLLVGEAERNDGLLGHLASAPDWKASERRNATRLHALRRLLIPDSLWEPVRNAESVLIVPDSALFLLPFEVLVSAFDDDGTYRFWLDDGPPVRYGPSFTALANLEHQPTRQAQIRPTALLVSNPAFDRGTGNGAPRRAYLRAGGRLEPLPGTAREAAVIAPLLRATGTEVIDLHGLAAEEAAVRASLRERPEILHLATHGLASSTRHELLASIAFTPPAALELSENDGFLQLYEVYGLRLNTELAVLSTCESFAGKRVAGEGVFALSRGFLIAGSRRVVASQWRVEDTSTAHLMEEFYRRLTGSPPSGSASYARSLRDAKRALRGRPEYAAPAFWGAFVLYGVR